MNLTTAKHNLKISGQKVSKALAVPLTTLRKINIKYGRQEFPMRMTENKITTDNNN